MIRSRRGDRRPRPAGAGGQLPRPRPPGAEWTCWGPQVGRDDMGARILVVDDDPLLGAALRRPLASEGFEVGVATSGGGALARAAEHAPDLVILDVLLPGIDGLAVCRQLRQDGDTPVLMLTAHSELPERVAGFEAGADDYLGKPFAFEELLL